MTEQAIPILMYHSISSSAQPRFAPYCTAPALFSQQMAFLAQQGYCATTVTSLVDARFTGRDLGRKPVLITFDDGFLDFYTHALPILQQYHFPATLFVTTSFVGQASRWLQREGEDDRPMLGWQHLEEIARAGIECGGHTHTHAALDALDASQARQEISQCKDLLEQRLGRPVASFAYPFGYYNSSVKVLVRQAGYRGACAVRHSASYPGDDLFALRRLMVPGNITLEQFASLVSRSSSAWSRLTRDLRETAATVLRRGGLLSMLRGHSEAAHHG